MRKINLILTFLLISLGMSAQFVNNGATVTIQAGATLRVETDVQNNGTGTITNNGIIEVSGNFTNAGTATLTPSVGLIKFVTATGSPANATLDAGGDALNNVEMAKTSNHTVTLTSPASMGGNLSFTGAGSKILLGAHDLTMTNAAGTVTATTDHPTNGYVVTNGTGRFVKSLTGNATVVHQIGDATNYTPVSNNVTASGAGTIGSRVYTSGLQAKYADATDYINREWNVVATGGVTANTMTGTYVAGDVNTLPAPGNATLIKGCTYPNPGTDWSFAGSAGAANQVTASTTATDTKLSGQNFFGKANLKAFLAGAFNGTSMTNTLRTNNLIPSASPYTVAPFNAPAITASSIPANATDWILVEVRDATTPSTVISQTSGFILNDGTIVAADGSSLKLKNAVPTGHIALRHRNHLAIRTASPIDLVNPPVLFNFSNTAIFGVNPQKNFSGVYAMWPGDVNSNNSVYDNAAPSDRGAVANAVITHPSNTGFFGSGPVNSFTGFSNVYSFFDVNLDGLVYDNASPSDSGIISNTVITHPANTGFFGSGPVNSFTGVIAQY